MLKQLITTVGLRATFSFLLFFTLHIASYVAQETPNVQLP